MKFTVERDALLSAVSAIHSVRKNEAIPILNNLLLQAENGELSVLAHAIDYCSDSVCAAEVETDGATTVPASEFIGLLSSAPEGSQVTGEMDGQRLKLRFGRSTYRLGTLSADQFPSPLEFDPTDEMDLTTEEANRLFGEPEFATSNTKADAYKQGIYLHNSSNGDVATVATTGVQLAKVAIDARRKLKSSIIVTQQTAKEIVRAAKTGPVHLDWSSNLITVSSGKSWFTSKLIDAIFPENYERLIIDVSDAAHFTFERKSLLGAIERLSLVTTNGIIEFSWDDEPASILGATAGGAGSENISCDATGIERGSMKLPPSQFLALLRAIESQHVDIYFAGPGHPLQIRIPARADYVALQMMSA